MTVATLRFRQHELAFRTQYAKLKERTLGANGASMILVLDTSIRRAASADFSIAQTLDAWVDKLFLRHVYLIER